MTRIGTQKMQRIIHVLYNALPEAAEVCAAAEFLIPYITRETDSSLPLLLGRQVACRPDLSLLETFTVIRPADVEAAGIMSSLASLQVAFAPQ
jgi:hypothetical protein